MQKVRYPLSVLLHVVHQGKWEIFLLDIFIGIPFTCCNSFYISSFDFMVAKPVNNIFVMYFLPNEPLFSEIEFKGTLQCFLSFGEFVFLKLMLFDELSNNFLA